MEIVAELSVPFWIIENSMQQQSKQVNEMKTRQD